MKKFTVCLIGTVVMMSSCAMAEEMWVGHMYAATPKHKGVTEAYCKSRIMETYEAPANMINKEVKAANGVTAKNLGDKNKQVGGIYMHEGSAMFSGITDGKPWKEKVHYFSFSLKDKNASQVGAWFNKDCKGFYKLGPANSM